MELEKASQRGINWVLRKEQEVQADWEEVKAITQMEKGLVHLETDQRRGGGARDVLPTPFIKINK